VKRCADKQLDSLGDRSISEEKWSHLLFQCHYVGIHSEEGWEKTSYLLSVIVDSQVVFVV
jgi:hypothetical protein